MQDEGNEVLQLSFLIPFLGEESGFIQVKPIEIVAQMQLLVPSSFYSHFRNIAQVIKMIAFLNKKRWHLFHILRSLDLLLLIIPFY